MYLLAWKQGLKGFTIYVDGSRDSVLFNDNSTSNKTNKIIRVIPPKRPKELEADFYTIKYKGEQFTVVVGLYEGDPYEIFAYQNNIELNIPNHKGVITKISKNHYSYKSDYLSIKNLLVEFNNVEEKTATLYPSQLLRQGAAPKYIIKTMKKVDDNIGSFTAAICRVLDKYTATETLEEKCPKCGNPLIREAGCKHCSNIECNWSACGD
jgi:ribonucleoside-diphosphate reductase alpha chain